MSNAVEKTPAQKKIKVRRSVLRLLDSAFKILEKWITGSIFLLLNFLGLASFFCGKRIIWTCTIIKSER